MSLFSSFLHPHPIDVTKTNKDIHMSLLSSFIASHLIPALESALGTYEPKIQEYMLAEFKSLSDELGIWLDAKINPVAAPTDAQITPAQ